PVPERRAQPSSHPRRHLRGKHQLRRGLLSRRRHHQPQVPRAPLVSARSIRHAGRHRSRERRIGTMVESAVTVAQTDFKHNPAFDGLDYHALNAMLNLYDANGKIQFDADKRAAQEYFLQHVNQNTVFFHSLKERLEYLVEKEYYEAALLEKYSFEFIQKLNDLAYSKKFRFQTFLGAFKYYTSYTLKTFDGKRYLERFED